MIFAAPVIPIIICLTILFKCNEIMKKPQRVISFFENNNNIK